MEIPEWLRLSIVAGNYSLALRRQIERQVAEEEAEIRLQAIARPEDFEDLLAEAVRREATMTDWRHPRTPRVLALESVFRDVALGSLPVASR